MRNNKLFFFNFLLFSFLLICLLLFGHTVKADTTIRLEVGNGDGYVYRNGGSGEDWDTLRKGDGNYGYYWPDRSNFAVIGRISEHSWKYIIRSLYPIDTSSLPDNAIIEKAVFYIYPAEEADNWDLKLNIFQGFMQDNTGARASDYQLNVDNVEPLSMEIDGSEWAKDGFHEFIFNEFGKNIINKTGYTVLCGKASADYNNSEPGPSIQNGSMYNVLFSERPDINKRPYLEVTYTLPDEPQINPVIVIPGIMGSWEKNGEWLMDPILHTYDNLLDSFRSAGYQEGKDLFPAPYQWRRSNIISTGVLSAKIREAKNACQCDKVDIVAHSMGGLVAREYIESADYGSSSVDQLIFLAAPHQGAPEAYLTWEGGEMGIGLKNKLMKKLFEQEAHFYNFKDLFSYVREFPVASIGELLPVYDYLRDAATGYLRVYPDNYPVNNFLALLNNPARLEKLSAVNITNFYASNQSATTINAIRVVDKEFSGGRWEHGYPEHYLMPFTDHGLEMGAGDGTVPLVSNGNFFPANNLEMISTHSHIVSDARNEVIKILTGTEPEEEAPGTFIEKLLLFRVFSPVDITVISPTGEKLGKDFAGAGEFNEIAGGFYSGFDTDAEFITIPNPEDGVYTVSAQGTEDGFYKISAEVLSDNNLPEPESIFVPGISSQGKVENFTVDAAPDSGEQPELIKQINFAGLILDLEELNNQGEILKRQAYNSLSARLAGLEKIYEKMSEKKPVWQMEIQKKMIILNLKLIKAKLKFYKNMQWITEDAFDVLNYDLDGIIQGL